MTAWHEDFLTVNDASMHYLRSGAGGTHRPLLMLHGFTDSARNCEVFARELTADYDVILMDARGHGLSSDAPTNYSLADQAQDVADFIIGLGLSKPAIFGHSIGAATAVQVAFQHPDLLSRVILEDPPFRSTFPQVDHSEWKASLTAFKQRPYEEQLAEALREHAHWGDDENRSWIESKKKFDLRMFDTPLANVFLNWREIAPHMTTPGLLITGDPELGAIVRDDVTQELLTLWKTLTTVPIENAGHSIRRDQLGPFMHIVKEYLREHYA